MANTRLSDIPKSIVVGVDPSRRGSNLIVGSLVGDVITVSFEEAPAPQKVLFLGRCYKCGEYVNVMAEERFEVAHEYHVHKGLAITIRCYKKGDPEQYHPVYHIRPYQLCPCCHYIEIHDALAAQGKACSYCREGQRVAHEINHILNYFVGCEKTTADDIKLWKKMQVHSWKIIPLTKKRKHSCKINGKDIPLLSGYSLIL